MVSFNLFLRILDYGLGEDYLPLLDLFDDTFYPRTFPTVIQTAPFALEKQELIDIPEIPLDTGSCYLQVQMAFSLEKTQAWENDPMCLRTFVDPCLVFPICDSHHHMCRFMMLILAYIHHQQSDGIENRGYLLEQSIVSYTVLHRYSIKKGSASAIPKNQY